MQINLKLCRIYIKITSYPYISCLHEITLPYACFVIWRSKWENRFIWDLLPTKKHYLFYITLNCTKCPRKCLLYLELVKTKLAACLIGFVFLNVLMENGEITITAKTRMAYEQGSLLSYTWYPILSYTMTHDLGVCIFIWRATLFIFLGILPSHSFEYNVRLNVCKTRKILKL